jgi:hypothetical protein
MPRCYPGRIPPPQASWSLTPLLRLKFDFLLQNLSQGDPVSESSRLSTRARRAGPAAVLRPGSRRSPFRRFQAPAKPATKWAQTRVSTRQGPSAGPQCRAPVQDAEPSAGPQCRAPVQDPSAGPQCRAPVQGPSAGPQCRIPVQDQRQGPVQGPGYLQTRKTARQPRQRPARRHPSHVTGALSARRPG